VLGFDRVGQLEQFALGGLERRERSIILESHLGCMSGTPMVGWATIAFRASEAF
jgi:hypothetical protein